MADEPSPTLDGCGVEVDESAVRTFLHLIYLRAAQALAGAVQPGLLQLSSKHPASDDFVPARFRINDVDHMVDVAVVAARTGHNVYVEGRTVSERLRGKARGGYGATRGVFAFVVDSDADKNRAGSIRAEPSLVVETSPGNRHFWYFLDRALTADQAQPIGQAIRDCTGADQDTGVATQPYRVAGTPNIPGTPRKLASGRRIVPTRILSTDGPIWTADQLRQAFPERPRIAPRPDNHTLSPAGSHARWCVERIVAESATPDMDRSAQFHTAVLSARWYGLSIDDLEQLMRQHPDGCAAKYLLGRDRLRAELERSWAKPYRSVSEVQIAPAYPDQRQTVDDARRAVEDAIASHFAAITSRHRA